MVRDLCYGLWERFVAKILVNPIGHCEASLPDCLPSRRKIPNTVSREMEVVARVGLPAAGDLLSSSED